MIHSTIVIIAASAMLCGVSIGVVIGLVLGWCVFTPAIPDIAWEE